MNAKIGLPPSRADIKNNLQAPSGSGEKDRFLNCRVTQADFEMIKFAAMQQRLSIGDYFLMLHNEYKRKSE